MSEIINITLEQLRGMIGIRLYYQQTLYQVVEVLEDGPSLVLQDSQQLTIQNNQHGDAQRKTPLTITIPVLTADKSALHADFLALEAE